jgi:2-phosphosulfolactate phosphatase
MRHALTVLESIELALLPAEAAAVDADCYLVVDVLRATTTIATLFGGGLTDLVVCDNIELARERALSDARLLFGEVGGLPPAGFDHGNSPVEARALDVTGRRAVLFTTNGTSALCALAARGTVVAAALSNASAVAGAGARVRRVAVVCAGNAGGARFSLEDFAAGGAIVQRLVRLAPNAELGDAAALAMTATGYDDMLAAGLPQRAGRSNRLITGSRHARGLVGLGLGADVFFALEEDTSAAVPTVIETGTGWARLEDAVRS